MTDNNTKELVDVKVTDPREEELARRRADAGRAIQRHFSSHPDGVIIASIAQGKIHVDVTPFENTGELLFAQKLIDKFIDESFQRTIMSSMAQAKQETPQ